MIIKIAMGAALVAVAALGVAGCQKAPAPSTEAAQAMTLPVSLNAMMVGMVDPASDFIFAVGNGDLPRNDHHWNQIRNNAYQIMIAGKAMQMAGTGGNDAKWVADPEWKRLSEELVTIGHDAVQLAEAKQTAGLDKVGDRLSDNCLACHEKFKPEIPSQGLLHEGSGVTEGSVFKD